LGSGGRGATRGAGGIEGVTYDEEELAERERPAEQLKGAVQADDSDDE